MNWKKFFGIAVTISVLMTGVVLLARLGGLSPETQARQEAINGMMAPDGPDGAGESSAASSNETAWPVSTIPVRDMPVGEYFPGTDQYQRWLNGEIDLDFEGIPLALRPSLLEEAMNLPPAGFNPAQGPGPILLDSWASIDSNACCGGGTLTPPDPEMAAGPNHVIAVVNAALEIYDKNGTSLVGPVTFGSFFASLGGGCQSFPFDPNVLYDESADRFIIAADGNLDFYCVGVSQTSDPTGTYHLYAFPTNIGGADFDYPHAGVGTDALYMGANLFGAGQGYVFAMDKAAMYAGNSASIVSRILSGGFHTTPQPINLHGWAQGTWPASGPHYFIAGTGFSSASTYQFYSWDDPFGANTLTHVTTFNFPAIHGVAVGVPVNSAQQGGSSITANDPRPLDFAYRNGTAWTAMSVSCNPGGGTVNCIQWAQINLASASVIQTDVFASTGEYRYFPDLAADHCGNALVGYSRSSSSSYPSVWVAGPVAAGANPPETLVKAGEAAHYTYSNRWGDYTGMTIDPDGSTFWYLGEYSPNNGHPSVNWGNHIGQLTLNCVPAEINVSPVTLSSDQPFGVTVTQPLTITNIGGADLTWMIEETPLVPPTESEGEVVPSTGGFEPAGPGCPTPSDIPWLSVAPTAGTTLGGASSTVDVSFDSTGLATGTYTGTLCISSNGAVNPSVTVPLTLTVSQATIFMPYVANPTSTAASAALPAATWLAPWASAGILVMVPSIGRRKKA